MAGKEGLAERLEARLDRLTEVLEAEIARLASAPAEHAAQGERVGKAVRSLAMGVRSIADAGGAVDRLRAVEADDEDDSDGEVDEEQPRLSPEAVEALRDDVRRRYSRFDRRGGAPGPADHGDGPAGAALGAAGLAGAGAHAPTAALR